MANDLFQEVLDETIVSENSLAYYEEMMDQYFKGIAPGYKRPNDYEFVLFVSKMREVFPPQKFTTPEGGEVFESPYILLMKHGENSKDDWERIQRLVPKPTGAV